MYPRVHVLDVGYQYCETMNWQRAAWLVYSGQAEALVSSDTVRLRHEFFLPRIIRLLKLIRRKYREGVPFNRANLYIRDSYRCRYCGKRGGRETLSLDHVMPISRGGLTSWENAVTACRSCNSRKDDQTPAEAGMPFIERGFRPYRPTVMEFLGYRLMLEGLEGVLDELGIT
jgi:5-methylcytosine-specific restriction endonuclease McrA